MKTFKETKEFIKKQPKKERFGYWLAYFKMKINDLWWRFTSSSFVNHISFLWHWKNFFFLLKYPFWKARNVWSGKFMGYSYTLYDEIPEGWRKAFGKELSEEIKKAGKESRKRLHKHLSWKNMLTFQQIKEKWGELCLYASATSEIRFVLDKYELLSQGYCINCGKPARYLSKSWVEFYCEDCFDKYLDTVKESSRLKLLDGCKLTKEDIPQINYYDKDGKVEINIKEKYDIDFEQLWGLKD